MADYIIGDLQGCFQPFMRLLQKIQYNPRQDTIWIAGDLINRGHNSLATLRFIYENRNSIKTVLGNHDLHMLHCYYLNRPLKAGDTFHDIMLAPDVAVLMNWLIEQPLCHYFEAFNIFLSHAGLYPVWTITEALQYGQDVQHFLSIQAQRKNYFENMYGNTPIDWNNNLKEFDRLRFITNAYTRMRFLEKDGALDFKFKGTLNEAPNNLKPWFNHSLKLTGDTNIVFGHWASLEGHISQHTNSPSHIFALDTGCVWGGQLTALNMKTLELISVE